MTACAAPAKFWGSIRCYVANEGKLVAIVPVEHAAEVVDAMRRHPLGAEAAVIGAVTGA